jgi:uncharacterized protein YgbK (DUF1537 family)
MAVALGAVADDFTGATDLAGMLAGAGMRTLLVLGVPADAAVVPDGDAVVVALKSRTIAPEDAVAQSLSAWRWLKQSGAQQAYFKYCSTFDSTEHGNIGPVAEALWRETGGGPVVFVPSLPENGRTVYRGRLFVFDQLLSESSMAAHPLTPMRDSNLVRVLGRQTSVGVGLITLDKVEAGPQAIRAAALASAENNKPFVIVDAISSSDLHAVGSACSGFSLVTGGSGLARGIAANFQNGSAGDRGSSSLPAIGGPVLCISGSCSAATNAQVARFESRFPVRHVDPRELAGGDGAISSIVEWAGEHLARGPCLVATTAPPESVTSAQQDLGRERAASLVENALAEVATRLRAQGVRRFVVAGGETSGAVAQALGVSRLAVGSQIAPGVPWCASLGDEPVALALKSGNFGAESFFEDAIGSAP